MQIIKFRGILVILHIFKFEGFTTLPLLKGNFVREIERQREKERNVTDDERKLQ